jgi:hypothetical protein
MLPNPTKLELDADKVVEMKRCWAKAGVPADTRIVDFVMQPIFEHACQGGRGMRAKARGHTLSLRGD